MKQKSSLIVLECTKQKILQVRTTEYPNGLGLTPAIKLLNPHSFCQVLKQSSGNYQTTPTLCCLVTSLFYFQRLLLQCCSAFTLHWSQLLQQLLQTATTSATFVCHYYRFTSVSRFFYRVNHMYQKYPKFSMCFFLILIFFYAGELEMHLPEVLKSSFCYDYDTAQHYWYTSIIPMKRTVHKTVWIIPKKLIYSL